MFNNLLNFLAKFLCQIVSAGCWKNSMKSKTKQKIFPPKLFLENSDYLEKWNLQLAKFPNFCCQNIMSYPNYQILFLSTDEIVRKISIITNVNQFFSLRKLFSQSKFPNFCWQNTMSYPNYQILSLSTDEIVKK